MPPINQPKKQPFLLIYMLINSADLTVLAAESHNYDDNTNRSIIQSAVKFIKDSQSDIILDVYYFLTKDNLKMYK